eukprot:7278545-Prorocentrum_lima.AAC.1
MPITWGVAYEVRSGFIFLMCPSNCQLMGNLVIGCQWALVTNAGQAAVGCSTKRGGSVNAQRRARGTFSVFPRTLIVHFVLCLSQKWSTHQAMLRSKASMRYTTNIPIHRHPQRDNNTREASVRKNAECKTT